MKPLVCVSIALVLVAGPMDAIAQDAQTFLYDANGRLIAVTTARPTSGAYANYLLDDADNRTTRNAYPTTSPTTADRVQSGQSLVPTQSITGGSYSLTLQTDGDLVVTGPSGVVQHSCTGTGRTMYAQMETGGNFVIRDAAQAILWQSNTGGHPGAKLIMQNDGRLAIKSGTVTHWSSTVTGGGCF